MPKFRLYHLFLPLILLAAVMNSQELLINEVMSSNSGTITDEDGETPDWIEIYNSGTTIIDLAGYGLSDDQQDPFKWVFPSLYVGPEAYLMVFASSKDRRDFPAHWETVINWADEWRYLIPQSEPSASWRESGFDDQGWAAGPTGIGYGDGDDATEVPGGTISVYMRKVFWTDDPSSVSDAFLNVDYDDAFVAYLNGTEIARENIGVPGTPPAFSDVANTFTEPLIIFGGTPVYYLLEDIQSLLLSGENVLAIQLHNSGSASSDLTMIPFLTLGLTGVPNEARGVPEILEPFLPHLHTNFKLDANGEPLQLTDTNANPMDEVALPWLPTDVSLGRDPDGQSWQYFANPTPGSENGNDGVSGIAGDPQFSHGAGFYSGPLQLDIQAEELNGAVHYTLDGTRPDDSSPVFGTPVSISETTPVRAVVYADGSLPGRILTRTFLIDETIALPVLSLTSTPANFWDADSGMYAFGDEYDPNFPFFGANFWQDWERPVHLEFFEDDGTLAFQIDAGAKIFGGWSRGFDQKSLSIFARNSYGDTEIAYPVFPDLEITAFESLVLRNSGNDWLNTNFRDGMITGLYSEIDIDVQAFRPAVIFLNGEYWGIQNIREKVNEHYIAGHYPSTDADHVDLLEYNGTVITGEAGHYQNLLAFLSANDIGNEENFEYVRSQMEVDNFIDYQAAQIFADNRDWPGNNIKFWRPQTEDGRWRWIAFDTDFGFGIWDPLAYNFNTLEFALDPNGPEWPNPPWSTFMLRTLMGNERFRVDFINRYVTHLNTVFEAEHISTRIDEIADLLLPEIYRHLSRWNGSAGDWTDRVQVLHNFAENRNAVARSHLAFEFGFSNGVSLDLDVVPPTAGTISIQRIALASMPFNGVYFQEVPVNLKALPRPGYRFAEWLGLDESAPDSVQVNLEGATALVARFEADSSVLGAVVINEINYNSALEHETEDWIELYNRSGMAIDLSGWQFKDEDDLHVYIVPENTLVPEEGHLVLCENLDLFSSFFPRVNNAIGNIGFGFSGGGELLRLYDADGMLIDSLVYDDDPPWPPEPDGNGPTLSLLNPDWDNSLAEHWGVSVEYGTPGSANEVVSDIDRSRGEVPAQFALFQNYPNPFNPETVIGYSLLVNSSVSLVVYNLAGAKIRQLVGRSGVPAANQPAGHYSVTWEGTNDAGTPVASGVYFYRLVVQSAIRNPRSAIEMTRKMLLLR